MESLRGGRGQTQRGTGTGALRRDTHPLNPGVSFHRGFLSC